MKKEKEIVNKHLFLLFYLKLVSTNSTLVEIMSNAIVSDGKALLTSTLGGT